MSEASSLVLAFRAHLIETLELAGVQRNAIEELCVEHERLLEFVRAECFALSPITKWLKSAPHNYFLGEWHDNAAEIRLENVETEEPLAIGRGATVEEAEAAALNRLMGKGEEQDG